MMGGGGTVSLGIARGFEVALGAVTDRLLTSVRGEGYNSGFGAFGFLMRGGGALGAGALSSCVRTVTRPFVVNFNALLSNYTNKQQPKTSHNISASWLSTCMQTPGYDLHL